VNEELDNIIWFLNGIWFGIENTLEYVS